MSTKCDHIDLYYTLDSAECRAVLITGKRLLIEFNLIQVSESNGERSEQLKKLNPYATPPAINDNGFILWESRAIMPYLINKYFAGYTLYPKDLKKRASIDRLMLFDIGSLRKSIQNYKDCVNKLGKLDDIVESRLWEKLKLLDTFLKENSYLNGNEITIADISIFTTVTDLKSMHYNFTQFHNLDTWIEKLKREFGDH